VTNPEPPVATPAKQVEPVVDSEKEAPEQTASASEKTAFLPPLDKQQEARILERGRTLSASGDVASARLAYSYAALRGSTDAMFALAQTYDPEVLASWNVVGIKPDTSVAPEWYGHAAQRGHDPADARIYELEKLSRR